MFLRRSLAVERTEIFLFARSRIFLAGIQPILAGFQFPNHNDSLGAWVEVMQSSQKTQRAQWLDGVEVPSHDQLGNI